MVGRSAWTYGSTAHHLLRHVNRLPASGTDISSSPATDVVVQVVGGVDDVLFARGREFGCKERLSRGWDVTRRLRPVTCFHGQDSCSTAVPVAFGSEAFAVTGATVNVPVMFRQVTAVQTTVAAFVSCSHGRRIGTKQTVVRVISHD